MFLKVMSVPLILVILISLAMTEGCDDRSAEVAREAADRQARQNEIMAHLQTDVAAGARQLVEEEGQARRQSLAIHQDVQAERLQLAGGWNELEAERRSIARSRQTASFLAALVTGGGGALAGLLALSFAWLVLFGLTRRDDSAEVVCALLVEDLVADRPLLGGDPEASPDNVARLLPPADRRAGSSPALPAPTQLDHPQRGETV